LKKILLSILLSVLLLSAYSQHGRRDVYLNYQEVDFKRVHYGFTLGVNYMDYDMRFKSNSLLRGEVAKVQPGLNVGLIGEYRFNKYFSVRLNPGFIFGGREISFSQPKKDAVDSYSGSVLAECPLLIKMFAQRNGNNRAYVIAGLNIKYDILSENHIHPESEVYIRNDALDYSLEFGVGVDFYMPFFKLSTELRVSFGLVDVLNHKIDKENKEYYMYTEGVDRMNSKIVSLLFHFE